MSAGRRVRPTGGTAHEDAPAALVAATQHLEPPFAVVDLDAFDRNADVLVERAGGSPIRVASKSVRCRFLTARVLRRPGFSGVLAFSLEEALWLVTGTDTLPADHDVLVAYPSVDRAAFERLAGNAEARRRIVVMADGDAYLDLAESVMRSASVPDGHPLRVCLDVDASYRIGRLHLGARRSPLRTEADVAPLVHRLVASDVLEPAGLMFYDAQIAGVADSSRLVRQVQRRSAAELAGRRRRIVEAAIEIAGIGLLVNAGGTGSLHLMGPDPSVTEVAAGSGLFAPHLFDDYRAFDLEPAAFFVTTVVRRPAPGYVTVFGAGLVASGAAGASRLPRPWWPRGLRLVGTEGAGEVQTPLRVPAGVHLEVGDRVWFRHAKAGELCERVDRLHLVTGGAVADVVPTYRGEERCFG